MMYIHSDATQLSKRSKVKTVGRIKTSSIFISSVVLVLAYSEALATTYGNLGSYGPYISQNFLGDQRQHLIDSKHYKRHRFTLRGGSFSLSALEKSNASEASSDFLDDSDGEVNVSVSAGVDTAKAKLNGVEKTQIAVSSKGNKKGFAGAGNGITSHGNLNPIAEEANGSCSFEDQPEMELPCAYIAETNLPTDIGHFRLRAYRIKDSAQHLMKNMYVGSEPCVIYSTAKPPFGQKEVPVRIHDQCFTSEVFRSQRYV